VGRLSAATSANVLIFAFAARASLIITSCPVGSLGVCILISLAMPRCIVSMMWLSSSWVLAMS
jgi:hypothetical protein